MQLEAIFCGISRRLIVQKEMSSNLATCSYVLINIRDCCCCPYCWKCHFRAPKFSGGACPHTLLGKRGHSHLFHKTSRLLIINKQCTHRAGIHSLILALLQYMLNFIWKIFFYITWARVLDPIASIKLCATISSPPCSFMMTSLRDELLIIDDRSCNNLGTPLRTESTSC